MSNDKGKAQEAMEPNKKEELDVRILKMIDIRAKQHAAKEVAVCLAAHEKMVKEQAKTNIKAMTKQFCSTTTAHGISKIVDADSKTARCLWIVILLACLTLFLYQATIMIKTYFDYPVVVEIKVVENSKLTFPAVTVCNNNRLRASKVPGTHHESLLALNRQTSIGLRTFLPNPAYPAMPFIPPRRVSSPNVQNTADILIFMSPRDYDHAISVCRGDSMQLCTTSQLRKGAGGLFPSSNWGYFSDRRFAAHTDSCGKDAETCSDCIAGRFPIKPVDQVEVSSAYCCQPTIGISSPLQNPSGNNDTLNEVIGTSDGPISVPGTKALADQCKTVRHVRRGKPCTASQLLQHFQEGVRFDQWGWFASHLRTNIQAKLNGSCQDESSTVCYQGALPMTTTLQEAGVFCCSPQVCVQSDCTAKASGCSNPLGMESGKIRDRQISSSSSFSDRQAHHGRLNALSFWQPDERDENPRFEVDFERVVILTGVVIQLDSHYSGLEGYMLEYGPNGTAWTRYVDEYGGDVHFCGTVDDDFYNIQHLPKAIKAKHIAILPLLAGTFYNNFHFRVEFLGCDSANCNIDQNLGSLFDVDVLQCSAADCYSNAATYRGRLNTPSQQDTCGNWSCPQSYRGHCLQENFCRVPPDSEVAHLVCPAPTTNGISNNSAVIPCVDIPRCPIHEGETDDTFPTSRTFYQYSFAKQYCNERGKGLCTIEDVRLMKIDDQFSADWGWFVDQKRQMRMSSGSVVFGVNLQPGRAAYCCDKLFRFGDKRYNNSQAASEACSQLGMQLCTTLQLEAAHKVGIRRNKYPDDLGWFSTRDRVALLNDTCGCSVGDMCYKRIIPFHLPSQEKSYKALCCQQTLITTDKKYDTIEDARHACNTREWNLCLRHQVDEILPLGLDNQEFGWTEDIVDSISSRRQASRVAHCCIPEAQEDSPPHESMITSSDVSFFNGCNNPLGMEAGTITSDQISADAVFSVSGVIQNAPHHSRLNGKSSWKMQSNDGWILIDLRQPKLITGIVTQGHSDNYVKTFTLYFSSHGFHWRPYTDNMREVRFMGNVDGNTPNHVYFPRAVVARYVRIHPKTWHQSPNLRLEIIGCKLDSCEIVSKVGTDSFFTPSDLKCWEKECIVGTGLNYRGFQNVTNSGRKCQKWDSHDPHEHCATPANFPDAGLVENYCRNVPGSLAKVPWCFTEDPKRPREFCPVEICDVGCIDSGLATVANDDDWLGFIQNSQTDDFSDVTDISTATKDEILELGHQKKDFILQCTFDKKTCSLDDFKISQNSKYGNCFTFNHDQSNVLETTKVGASYGLKLTLNIESNEYVGIFGQDPGVKVTVHRPGSTPLPEVNALSAEPGKSTFIGLKRRVVSRQPHPYGNCSLSTETDPLYGGLYSFESCKRSCLQKALIKECGCSDELLAINSTICSALNETQECCRQKVRKEHESNEVTCACYQPCYEEAYEVWVSSSLWPSQTYSAYVLEKIHSRSRGRNLPTDLKSIQKNLVRLHLYYQDLNHQEIMDVPSFTEEALFSSLGGLLGLYVGLSVITIFEFCHLVVDMVKVFLKLRKPKGTLEEE